MEAALESMFRGKVRECKGLMLYFLRDALRIG